MNTAYATVLRWVGRLLGLASLGLLSLFIVGEGFPFQKILRGEFLIGLLFPLGVMAGLVLAWWRSGVGGLVTVGSLLAFYAVHYLQAGQFPRGIWFAVFASPAIFSLADWLMTRTVRPGARA